MAGLGEVCTHVAAVMFYVEISERLNGAPTCTQQKCQWVIPAYQKDIPYAPLHMIDFSSAKSKKHATPSVPQPAVTVRQVLNPEVKQEVFVHSVKQV